jgi:diguanylate cyclase (GGDEF)-like protein
MTVERAGGIATTRSTWFIVTVTAGAVALLYAAADRVEEDVLGIESLLGKVLEVVTMGITTCVVLWAAVLRPLHRQAEAQRQAAEARQLAIEQNAAQQHFESQLHRALEMAFTEEMAYASTAKALRQTCDEVDAELLLADSSEAHLKRAVALADDGPARCPVASPHDCPAIRRSQTLVFASSSTLDACPFLDGRPGGPCSAACVPVSVGGRSIGVLHTAARDQEPPTAGQVRRLESIATQSGSRIGMLRVMSATKLQAATDPLTGLLNRRAFENRVHALLRVHQPFALAMGDLDHFKRLNDTHGHDAGDRALRLFTRVVQRALRSEDIISRYGGEEFVVVFPDRTATQAATALRRMQELLVVALTEGSVPGFSVSYGVTDTTQSTELDELCRIADAALFRAKRAGRNRVVVDVEVEPDQVDMDRTVSEPERQPSAEKSATDHTASVSSETSSTVRMS